MTTTTTTTTEEDDDDAADQHTVGRRSPLQTCAALDVLSSLCDHARDGRRSDDVVVAVVVVLRVHRGGHGRERVPPLQYPHATAT